MLNEEEKLDLLAVEDVMNWEDYDRDVYNFIVDVAPQVSPMNWEDKVRRAITRYIVDCLISDMFDYVENLVDKGIDGEKALGAVLGVASSMMFEIGFRFGAYYRGDKGHYRR